MKKVINLILGVCVLLLAIINGQMYVNWGFAVSSNYNLNL